MIIILLIFFSGLAWLIYNYRQEDAVAEIYKNGELIKSVVLEDSKDFEFTVGDENEYNVIQVKDGSIGVVSASCPDKICISRGFVSGGVMPIVCLPNDLVIEIKGGESEDADAVAG